MKKIDELSTKNAGYLVIAAVVGGVVVGAGTKLYQWFRGKKKTTTETKEEAKTGTGG